MLREDTYYFVALGREKGSYLDLLGLPPTASIEDVSEAGTRYILDREADFKQARKEVREKLKNGEITQEQCDSQIKALEDIKTEKLTHKNELQERYEAARSETRRLVREGFILDDTIWVDLCDVLTFDLSKEFWEALYEPRALPVASDVLLDQVQCCWIQGAGLSAGPDLPSNTVQVKRGYTLNLLVSLLVERAMINLLWADELWWQLKYTNRDHWHLKVLDWLDEASDLSQPWRTNAAPDGLDSEVLFPELCNPPELAIKSLQTEPIVEHANVPHRAEFTQQQQGSAMSARDLLELLRAGRGDASASPDDPVAQLMRALEQMTRGGKE